jgi:hypothetical protein
MDDDCPDAHGTCPECGSTLFVVEVGVTRTEEIIAFAANAEGWKENPEALAGWMPPGVYCPGGCYAIHATPAPDAYEPELAIEPDGVPRPVRIGFADVMRDGGSYTLFYDSENKETVKVLLRVITTDTLRRTGYRNPQLITVDPLTYEKRCAREIDWDDAAKLGTLLLPLISSGKKISGGGASRATEMIRYLSLRGSL